MPSAFSKILMATDFGSESAVALRSCAALARSVGASIHLLHVVKDPILAAGSPELYGLHCSELRDDLVKYAERTLAALAASFPDITITTEVVIGYPAETIANRAEDLDANLIVMGTHGRGTLARVLLGSVAQRVVATARCPVLTVRGT
jgi:nucleotide-binding universal stress UspA family protein